MPARPTRKLLMKGISTETVVPKSGSNSWLISHRRDKCVAQAFQNGRTQAKTRGIDVALSKNKFT